MHILVTNDDGPPSSESSPYVLCLVRHLQQAGHVVSVCLPHTQRSWIAKAHMIGQTLKPLYYRPAQGLHGEGSTHQRPSPEAGVEEWILIDGTPASCVQIGLNHFFQDRGPVDLVVSGPNYGRNTSSVFALSSGTLGAAMEAAVCRQKAIALSFAFFSRNHDPTIIEAACRHSLRVLEALYRQWPTDGAADLYSVNVPLVDDVERNKTLWTDMLQNYWSGGSCFEEIDDDDDAALDATHEELLIREGPGGEAATAAAADATVVDKPAAPAGHTHKHFKWAPRLANVYKSVAESGPGNDGRTVKEGNTSITPLKANFAQGTGAFSRQEFELDSLWDRDKFVKAKNRMYITWPCFIWISNRPPSYRTHDRSEGYDGVASSISNTPLRAVVAYDDAYVQPLIVSALRSILSDDALSLVTEYHATEQGLAVAAAPDLLSKPEPRILQITAYESIDFEYAASHTRSCLINSYMIRKALIRKHFLSATVDHWVAKKPTSPLATHFKRCEAWELDYAEFLDDALVEAFDLRASMDRNTLRLNSGEEERGEAEWWILKPGMSDGGQGIRLFSTMEELQAIFDEWEGGDDDDEDDDDDCVTTSQLRHFVAQPYIHPPLLLESDPRKFHIRAYVLSVGSLKVYVYKPMLALFAAKSYQPPWVHDAGDSDRFLTNTCLAQQRQKGDDGERAATSADDRVRAFWDLPLSRDRLDDIFAQICRVTGDVFEAAATAMPVHFQPLPNAFEVFGLDFLVDAGGVAWLLEANAFPDFKQTGQGLASLVQGFWAGVVREAVLPFFDVDSAASRVEGEEDMVLVGKVDVGVR
ncbi:hypothetical protein CP532_5059 [Ophiocordyceps camponoti-leonardi (nom. inval.)]|nr:hypothetical protein CP532_5059 [Ophiocordyceps camponoti-leonardi (nom. inval.)]